MQFCRFPVFQFCFADQLLRQLDQRWGKETKFNIIRIIVSHVLELGKRIIIILSRNLNPLPWCL
jgi:hypothetical protein